LKVCLVTGSSGLIGSEAVSFFHRQGFRVHGIDNNQREASFSTQGNTRWNQARLQESLERFTHRELDIRHRVGVRELVAQLKPFVIILMQPSHDLAAHIPFDDFDMNAGGTLNLLEATHRHCPESLFIHMSTNKVMATGRTRLR
jgi:CDP-paratose 2-epimerase